MYVVATAGHVDHGKSALLRRLTGMEPDRWDEERRRGLTIDLGYVWTDLPRHGADRSHPHVDGAGDDPVTVAFVDVPGHDGFLPNMLCGVGVVEQVLFVVAADDGWSAQSEEHLEILDLLQRRAVAAVVTKAELAGPDRTAAVVRQVRDRLAATSLHDAPVLPVDSLSGTGVDALRTVIVDRLLAAGAPSPAPPSVPATRATRMWIDRVFTVRGAGTVVTGMLAAGELTVGQDVEVEPHGLTGRIRGMQVLERAVSVAAAGTRVAVNLGGMDRDVLGRGDVLVEPGRHRIGGSSGRSGVGTAIDVELRALPHTGIGRSGAWHVHLGTAATTATVWPLLGDLAPGAGGHARIELTSALPLRAGDRFVLREAGRWRTVGGGTVLDPAPLGRRRGTDQRLAHAMVLEQLAEASGDHDRMAALVDAHGGDRDANELRAIIGSDDLERIAGPDLVLLGDRVVRAGRLAPWRASIERAARDAPPEHAIELARLTAAAAAAGCPAALATALVDRGVREGELHTHGGRFVHHEHEPVYLDARGRRWEAFTAALSSTPLAPPDPAAAAADAGIPSFEVQELIDQGAVVACGPLVFTAEALTRAVALLRDGPGRQGAAFTASDARQAWATTRRCAMPLLDHLRATGVTAFDGDRHRLLTD